MGDADAGGVVVGDAVVLGLGDAAGDGDTVAVAMGLGKAVCADADAPLVTAMTTAAVNMASRHWARLGDESIP